MAVDYGAKEQEFIASLEADTGRGLAEWMAAIDGAGLGHRNDIIDWLRQQGFLFSKASWLERIHHNGGRPIYGDGATTRRGGAARRISRAAAADTSEPPLPSAPHRIPAGGAQPPVNSVHSTPHPAPAFEYQRPPPATATVVAFSVPPRTASTSFSADPALATLLATAKAYRPLAQLLLTEIAKACPDLSASIRDDHVALAAPVEFGVIVVSPKEIRLGLDLGGWPFAAPLQRAKLNGPPGRFGHMVVLTDARQIDAHLLGFVRAARDRANRG